MILATAYDADNPMPEMMYRAVEGLGIEVSRATLRRSLWRRYPRDCRPVVHLHWIGHLFRHKSPFVSAMWSLRYIALLVATRLRRFKVVWTLHNEVSHGSRHRYIEDAVRGVLVRWLTDGIVVMTHASASAFEARYGHRLAGKVFYVPHPVYSSFYGAALPKPAARERFGLAEQGTVYLFFGQVREYKDVGGLEDAFKHLEGTDARLILAGVCDPADAAVILQSAEQDSRILVHLERVPDEDVADLVSASDWVVLPYREVSNSGVMLLALSYGRPVVAPAVPTLEEVLGPKLASACYEIGEVRSLERAIGSAERRSQEQQDVWEAYAADRACEFSLDECAAALAAAYVEVASLP